MNRFALDNARLWIGDGQSFDGHIVVAGEIIESVGAGRASTALPRVDIGGAVLSPGLVDLMVLGGFNKSILRDDPLEIAREYLKLGVTAAQFCVGTLPWDSLEQVAANVARARTQNCAEGARVLGLYAEGPFQQPDLSGASLREFALPPSPANVARLIEVGGRALTMANVAPGLEGDVAAIEMLKDAGLVASMAHSDAPAERATACVAAGTSVLGHIWDNNGGLRGDSGVQQPTIEHVALTDERVRFIHLICDGVHVDPVLVQMSVRCRGVGAFCLVTDAVVRAGCADGAYFWDDGREFFKAGGVGRTAQGHLSGSALLLPDHFRNFVRFTGLAPATAIATVTLNPAASLGLENQIGVLAPGRAADIVAWDESLQIRRVWRRGREVDDVSSWAEVKFE